MTSGSRMACRTLAAPAPSASSATPTGKPFHTTTLRRVLTNPRMAGLRVHRGEVIGALAGEEFAASLQEQMRAWAGEDPATAAQEEIRAQWQGGVWRRSGGCCARSWSM